MTSPGRLVSRLIPPLSNAWRKGQQGRVGVVGGSFEYTGAPFYAGIAALKTGADLCHIFCTEEAAIPIKSYSPELIVHPLLVSDASTCHSDEGDIQRKVQQSVDRIASVFSRLDALILGPGLGRDRNVQTITEALITKAREVQLPIIVDGDALFLASQRPEIIRGYRNAILTPNAMEYARLCVSAKLLTKEDPVLAAEVSPLRLSEALGYPVIVQKGRVDRFSDGKLLLENDVFGCPRRCGGQGDVLTGAIATFVSWSKNATLGQFDGNPLLLAAFGGSTVTRASALEAFVAHGRSMTSPDVLQCIGKGFQRAYPDDTETVTEFSE